MPATPRRGPPTPTPPRDRLLPQLLLHLALLAQLAALVRPALAATPYSCKMDFGAPTNRPIHDFNATKDFIVGIKGTSSAVIVLQESKEPSEQGAKYDVLLTEAAMAIQREGVPMTESAPMPAGMLDDHSFRYFWLRAADGQVSFGRAGEGRALVTMRDSAFKPPTAIQFPVGSFFLHSCSDVPVNPPLGCRKHTISSRYEFSESFSVEDEQVTLADGRQAIRFLVKSSRDTYVRLKSSGSTYFEIDLNFVNKLAIQRGAVYLNSSICLNCLSWKEFRLFTIVYDESHLELHEGASVDTPSVSVAIQNFKITSISFASMSSAGSVHWLHACQGLEKALQVRPAEPGAGGSGSPAPTHRPPPQLPAPVSPEVRQAALNSPDLLGCRFVNTFKYSFDGYFALSEEGVVIGPTTVLPFRVLGRKDVHLQLVSSIPPTGDDYYEIDIDFYNHTNVDRGRAQQKVATVQQANVLSASELRSFVIVHDATTGVLNITWVAAGEGGAAPRGVPIVVWRDPKPFALRYFSICSGSSAGNDTTWVFGCPGHQGQAREDADRNKTGCSRPLLTYKYSHSQYLSLEREGTVNGSQRAVNLFLRAQGSGHVRLEHALPPAVDALFEVDLSHEGNTSIDYMGKQVASLRTPGLLNEAELRGFWVRQDVAARRLEVGRQGEQAPVVSWTAPAASRFPEIQYFSLATSRSVGNGTWFYGCKDGSKPEQTELVADPEQPYDIDESLLDLDLGSPELDLEPIFPPFFRNHFVTASKALQFRFHLIDQPPAEGTVIGVRLTVNKVYLDDVNGAAVVRGHLLATWQDPKIKWEPKEFEDIKVVNNVDVGWSWVPELTVFNGELELGGVLHLHHSGAVRWEASLRAQAHCALAARRWPRDRHDCELKLGLASGEGRTLHLLEDHEYTAKETGGNAGNATARAWVAASAAEPLWHLEAMSVAVADGPGPAFSPVAGNVTLRLRASLGRRTPVLHHVLLAPFVVLSALCLLAYWVRDPLPRDKVALGCAALLLLVLAFLVLEAACPPGLVGMPAIVEVYCWCVCVLALAVVTSAVMTALAREEPLRSPPAVCCSLVSHSFLRWILLLDVDLVHQRVVKDELSPNAEDYRKGSAQVYTRFDHDSIGECVCKSKACSKQVAMEARYYWTLLALACERVLSIICFVLLIIAVVLVK